MEAPRRARCEAAGRHRLRMLHADVVQALEGVRVVDLTTGVAGPYATKLFADAGAEVIKVEPPEGDALRRWSATGDVPDGEDGAFFRYLHTSKRSWTGDAAELFADAAVVFEEGTLDVDAVRAAHPHLVVVSITGYGRTGPWAGRPWTDFTVQAASGMVVYRGDPQGVPYQGGGRVAEFTSASYAAAAGLAATVVARRTGVGAHVDLSMTDVMAIAGSTFTDLLMSLFKRPPVAGTPARSEETPSIEPTKDGWIGFNTNAGHHFQQLLLLIERPDLLDVPEWHSLAHRVAHLDEWHSILRSYTTQHTTAEILELGAALRIPVTDVNSGETVQQNEHLVARRVFVDGPHGFRQPRPPYQITDRPPRPFEPAPAVGDATGRVEPTTRPAPVDPPGALPFEGTRIVDLTSWWAGPAATHLLALLGAEVIHIESTRHPDGMRTTGLSLGGDPWWEWGHLFLAINTDKLGVTLDLTQPRGLELTRELIRISDAVVENFSPRVVEQWGLDWDEVHRINPRAVLMRMPAFGLSGPWRDRVGFAQTMEQMSGMAWVTGHRGGPPNIVRGPCDPIAGMHGAFALLVALEEARRTGEGVFVEAAMIEAALNCAAEPIVEWNAYGRLLERDGNRSPHAAPQGLYPCRDAETWLAVSVVSDQQWRSLRTALGEPAWAADAALDIHAGRRAAHDRLDKELAAWAVERDAVEAAELLVAAGVPASPGWDPRRLFEHPQLQARGLYEDIDHPAVGRHPVPGAPFRWSGIDHWLRSPAPTLGQDTRDVLTRLLGLSASDLDDLESAGVIGTRPVGY